MGRTFRWFWWSLRDSALSRGCHLGIILMGFLCLILSYGFEFTSLNVLFAILLGCTLLMDSILFAFAWSTWLDVRSGERVEMSGEDFAKVYKKDSVSWVMDSVAVYSASYLISPEKTLHVVFPTEEDLRQVYLAVTGNKKYLSDSEKQRVRDEQRDLLEFVLSSVE